MLCKPLWMLALAAALGCAVAVTACVGGPEGVESLNPQPLPPGQDSESGEEPGSGETGRDPSGSSGSGGSGGMSPPGADAGAVSDGGDEDSSDGGE